MTELRKFSLADKYDLNAEEIFLTGVQALARIAITQTERDRRRGLNTAGFVTGYRGSPLSAVDIQFTAHDAQKALKNANVVFRPALNEDLAAAAVWGTQQAELRGEGKYDGVFAFWYGKGPGVDRSGDAFRHANMAGVSPNGGVLALLGDDHAAESSVHPHQSEFALVDAMMPILAPADVQQILDFGILGIAMSRKSGCWIGLKCVHDAVEAAAVVNANVNRIRIRNEQPNNPQDDGVHIRIADDRFKQEIRLHRDKLNLAIKFARRNNVNHIVAKGGDNPRIALVAAGKAYSDLREALARIKCDTPEQCDRNGIRVVRIGMPWPLDTHIIHNAARGAQKILVVEEKRDLIENQIRGILYGGPHAPPIIGKRDERGENLIPPWGVVDAEAIANHIRRRLNPYELQEQTDHDQQNEPNDDHPSHDSSDVADVADATPSRRPFFCAGCPHNTSTVVPEGSRAYAGIGCHWMVQSMPERRTQGSTHMGAEGANWIGEAPFSTRNHVFQNIGDGTYNHSGILAIRDAVAAGVSITFKILFNDAVAMTGGQKNDGKLNVTDVVAQLQAEGVKRIAVVAENPFNSNVAAIPKARGLEILPRERLNQAQEEFAALKGVTAIVYDQTCAAEKRRRRKRGEAHDPDFRIIINERVCEGCGDCGRQSNCVAVTPLKTHFGIKRQINQATCNKDASCLKGFCPSFVTVKGGRLRRADNQTQQLEKRFAELPEPPTTKISSRPYALAIAGIGGTGVITVGHLIAVAAHLERKGVALIDMIGLAQKNGAVATHMKIADAPENIAAARVGRGRADALIACDSVAALAPDVAAALNPENTNAVVNDAEIATADFVANPDFQLPFNAVKENLRRRTRNAVFLNASDVAEKIFGDAVSANLILLGAAVQSGVVPISPRALEQAVRINRVAVETNLRAFAWGRLLVAEPDVRDEVIKPEPPDDDLDAAVARAADDVKRWDKAGGTWRERYLKLVAEARRKEESLAEAEDELPFSQAVARAYHRAIARKDEYEVASLFADGEFERRLAETFEGDYQVTFHLAPPLPFLRARDPATGRPKKRTFGHGAMRLMRLLARAKILRDTPFDLFGYSRERRRDREFVDRCETIIQELIEGLRPDTRSEATRIVESLSRTRGFGDVRDQAFAELDRELPQRLAALRERDRKDDDQSRAA